MRLGRRLSTGVAEHPPAPTPAEEPRPVDADVEVSLPAEPVELAER